MRTSSDEEIVCRLGASSPPAAIAVTVDTGGELVLQLEDAQGRSVGALSLTRADGRQYQLRISDPRILVTRQPIHQQRAAS